MMIRINLLPVRQVKSASSGRQFLVVAAASWSSRWSATALVRRARDREQADRRSASTATKQPIAELEKVIGEVNNINNRAEGGRGQARRARRLRKGRTGPVRMLDALATATPKKVWLTRLRREVERGEDHRHRDEPRGRRRVHARAGDHGLDARRAWGGGRAEARREDRPGRAARREGAMEDFPTGKSAPFFTNIDLKKAESKATSGCSERHATHRRVRNQHVRELRHLKDRRWNNYSKDSRRRRTPRSGGAGRVLVVVTVAQLLPLDPADRDDWRRRPSSSARSTRSSPRSRRSPRTSTSAAGRWTCSSRSWHEALTELPEQQGHRRAARPAQRHGARAGWRSPRSSRRPRSRAELLRARSRSRWR